MVKATPAPGLWGGTLLQVSVSSHRYVQPLCDGYVYAWILPRDTIMSGWLLAVTGFIYTVVAIEQGYKGNTGMAIAYAGYAFSNIGLWKMTS